jgi:sulfatase maturation enzyme AslB (radical SAM superfamily)
MSEETAMKALAVALSVPPRNIKIEFQGGEPLLNFDLIRTVVIEAERRSQLLGRVDGIPDMRF